MTYFALSANLSVEIDSSLFSAIGETVAMRHVFVFPPSESCNNLVSLESLYGTWWVPIVLMFIYARKLLVPEKSDEFILRDRLFWFLWFLERDEMTLPSVVKDKLIVLSSYICDLSISSSLFTFSDPARSQRFSFALLIMPRLSTVSVSTNS